MKYCKSCIIPNTRPDQFFQEDGICIACKNFNNKKKINWVERKKSFDKIIDSLSLKSNEWNCIIPSSGGKDSTYQALKCRELGLKPLIVTATTCDRSEIGLKNIENLKNNGFDTIEFSTNPKIREKINKFCLNEIGDISWPEHVTIFTIPFKIAVYFNIKLIIYGENPQFEYGGPPSSIDKFRMNREWMEEFGGLIGLRVQDLLHAEEFSEFDISAYKYPSSEDLVKNKITGLFLGHFFEWDSIKNFEISKKKWI